MRGIGRANQITSFLLFFSALLVIALQLRSRGFSFEGRAPKAEHSHDVLKSVESLQSALESYVTKHNELTTIASEKRKNSKYLIYTTESEAGE